MPGQTAFTRRQATDLGRSGPRSKTGCQTCKTRRVRCDEQRPVCGHCDRLKLDCAFLPPRQRRSRLRQASQDDNPEVSNGVDSNGYTGTDIIMDSQDGAESGSRVTSTQPEGLGLPALEQGAQQDPDSQPAGALRPQPSLPSVLESAPGEASELPVPADIPIQDSQYLLDSMPAISSDANAIRLQDAPPALNNFALEGQDRMLWLASPSNDCSALPDPSFPFTSMAFIGSLETLPPNDAQDWRAGGLNSFPNGTVLPMSVNRDAGSPPPLETADSMPDAVSRLSFTVSPPLLSPSQEENLLTYFRRDIRPPASLVGVDPVGWSKIRRHILRMAQEKHQAVLHALYALTTLLSSSTTIRLGINRNDHILFASRLQEAACAAMYAGVASVNWERRESHALLVSVFLLAWFETAYDENTAGRPSFPTALAERIIVHGQWDQGMSHVFQWLSLMDSKSSHLGGRHLLSEPSLQVARESRSSHAGTGAAEDADDSSVALEQSDAQQGMSPFSPPGAKSTSTKRLAYMLSSSTHQALPTRSIRMDIFNILLQPAFEFHMASQAYSRRIGCHDRHHRPRGTPEDELEIMTACMGFEEELQELWRRRPGILTLNSSQLKQFVSIELALRLEQLFSVYMASFWGHFIYIHRVAFWSLDHTPMVKKALEETGNMMRRSVGQSVNDHEFDGSIVRTPSNSIHPGLMWTCFMFGCEVMEQVQEKWAVSQLRSLGSLQQDSARLESDGAELLVFTLDEKGAQNALKASELLETLVERQKKAGTRVDGKYLCQEIFGCHFYII